MLILTVSGNEFEAFIHNGTDLDYPGFYGDGKTAEFILNEILHCF